MILKKIIKRWKEIKALINADEYFLAIANPKSNKYDDKYYVKEYHYMKNTNRTFFYKFVNDHIKTFNKTNS